MPIPADSVSGKQNSIYLCITAAGTITKRLPSLSI